MANGALEDKDGGFLVKIARQAIQTWLKKKEKVSPPPDLPRRLQEKLGVFVTLNKVEDHQLRGCIGFPLPIKPIVEATINAAIEAATGDPRFPPLNENELNRILVEVSILTPPKTIKVEDPRQYPDNITIGEDGLIVEKDWSKGLLLPQVPVEWNMDEEEFLCNCCLKAGLPPDSWLSPKVKIQKFQALIFSENKPQGQVTRKTLK